MTKQPASGNDTGLPALKKHLAETQDLAGRVQSLCEVIEHLETEGVCHDGRYVLTEIVGELAAQVHHRLDSTNLPEVSQ